MSNKELKEIIEELLKQPEGLKFDFKVILHIAECTDKSKQDGFRSEFIRDILALANGNIGTAGQTAYLIVGAADKLDSDGKRKLQDSSHIRLTGKEILQKINSCCRPPIPDIQTEFVDVSGTQLFVTCIPPTPYLHETTQDLKLPNGKIYPKNSVFIRHGEEIDCASIAEIDAIRLEKDLWQRNLDGVKSNGVMSLEERKYLEAVKRKYQDWWEDSYAFMNEINDATWQELQLTVKTLKSNLNNEANSLSASDGDDKTTILPILDALRQVSSERVLIVGKAGAGKSTILAKVLLNAAKEALQAPTSPIPVLIKLKNYQSPSDFLLLIRDSFKRFGFLRGMKEPEQITYIEKLINDKRLLLLADGVNELSSDNTSDFKHFLSVNSDYLLMIATTRNINASDLDIQTKLEIQPLSAEKVKDFFIKKLPDNLDIRRVQELCDRVRDFGQTPLMVWMLYIIFKQNPFKGSPNTRGEAYREFTTIYVERAKEGVDLDESKLQLSNLAFEMIHCEQPIYESKVQSLIGTKPLKHLLSNHLLQWDGMLGSRKVQFCHQSLQEYYAAEYILTRLPELTTKRKGQKYTLFQTDYLNHLKWTEAIAIMLGLPEIDNRAEQLVKLALDVDLTLGARLAGETTKKDHPKTISLIARLEIPKHLQIRLLGLTRSDSAIHYLDEILNNDFSGISTLVIDSLTEIGSRDAILYLSKNLKHKNIEVRRSVAIALREIREQSIVQDLLQTVRDKHEDSTTRIHLVGALGKIGDRCTVPTLIEILSDEDEDDNVRMNAASSIKEIEGEHAVPYLQKILLESESHSCIWVASMLLSDIGGDDAKNALRQALQIDKPFACMNSASALALLADKESVPFLVDIVNNSLMELDRYISTSDGLVSINNVLSNVINALGCIKSQEVEIFLRSLLNHSDPNIRRSAILALGKVGQMGVVPILAQILRNKEPENAYSDFVRAAAVEALGETGCKEAIPILLEGLEDESHLIQQFSVTGLEKLKHREIIPILVDSLRYGSESVKQQVAVAFDNIGSDIGDDCDDVVAALISVLDNNQPETRFHAAQALWRIGNKNIPIAPLLKALEDKDSKLRMTAARTLEITKNSSEEIINALLKALKDSDLGTRICSAGTLGQIGGAELISIFWELRLENYESHVDSAIAALQLRYQFYNYEIANFSKSETQKTDNLYPSTQGLTIVTDKQPIINFNQNNATIGVNYAAENSNIKFQQNVNITEQDLAIAAQKIQSILNQLAQTYPTTTEIQKQDFIHKFLERIESTPDLIKVILTGGIEWVKALFPLAGIPIEMSRSVYEAVKKRHNQS